MSRQQGAHQQRPGPQTQRRPGGQWAPKPTHAALTIGVAFLARPWMADAPLCRPSALVASAVAPRTTSDAANVVVNFLIWSFPVCGISVGQKHYSKATTRSILPRSEAFRDSFHARRWRLVRTEELFASSSPGKPRRALSNETFRLSGELPGEA
jgi:hypothetical protein